MAVAYLVEYKYYRLSKKQQIYVFFRDESVTNPTVQTMSVAYHTGLQAHDHGKGYDTRKQEIAKSSNLRSRKPLRIS